MSDRCPQVKRCFACNRTLFTNEEFCSDCCGVTETAAVAPLTPAHVKALFERVGIPWLPTTAAEIEQLKLDQREL